MSSDLHMHTSVSDGRLSPEALVAAAKRAGLRYMAVTDHDAIDGVEKLQQMGLLQTSEIDIFPGIEFSADMPEHEAHILGYGIDTKNKNLRECLQEAISHRWKRLEKMLRRLRDMGYEISLEEVKGLAGDVKSIGRAHIAQILVKKKYFSRLGEAFADVLHKNGTVYAPHYRLSPREIITLIKEAHGVSVLAHPGQIGSEAVVSQIIAQGIDGLEVFHPKHSAALSEYYRNIAIQSELLITGGSDYHAIPTRYPAALGEFSIDDCYAVKLKETIALRA